MRKDNYILSISKDGKTLYCSRRQEYRSFLGMSVSLDFGEDPDEAVDFYTAKEAWFIYHKAAEGKNWQYHGWLPQVKKAVPDGNQ